MGTNPVQKKMKQQQRQQKKADAERRIQLLMAWTLGVVVVVCIALFVVKAVSDSSPVAESEATAGTAVDQQIFQYDQQPSIGSKDAPVKIVEFADFKCPACQKFDELFVPELKKDFIDTGIVQLHFLNYPIISPNGDSRTAAEAAEAVFHQNPEAFFGFYEAVFKNQQDERTKWATSDTLVQIAKDAQLKLDFDKLKQDIDNHTYAQAVKDDEAIVKKLNVRSTPTLFINGQAVPDHVAFNYDSLQQAIRAAQNESAK